jgi:hypothetical protein
LSVWATLSNPKHIFLTSLNRNPLKEKWQKRFFILFRARVHSYFVWLCASRLTGFALTGSIKRILCCFHWMYSVGSCSCVDVPFTPSYAVVKRNKLIACSVSHVSSWFLSTFLLDVLNVFVFIVHSCSHT